MPKIPDHRFEIPEAALGICAFASDKKSQPPRPGLEFICIEPELTKKGEDSYIHAVATNGYHLVHLRWIPDPEKDMVPDGTLLISAAAAAEFLKGRRPKDTRYWITEEKGNWAVVGDHGDRMKLGDSPADFPDWRDVIPKRREKHKEEVVEFGLNWKCLEVFCKFSKRYLGRSGFKVSVPKSDVAAVLLIPVRVGIEDGYDDEKEIEVEYLLNDGVTEMEYILMGLRV